MVGLILTENQLLISLSCKFVDVSEDAETGEYIAGQLKTIIEELDPHKIASVVTAHASCMKKAWEITQLDFPWIQTEGCKSFSQ